MSFSNSKQHNHPRNSNAPDRTPKGSRNNQPDYLEDQGSYVKKNERIQGETSYHRKPTQDNLENSQNYHKSSRTRQNRGNYEDMRNYEEGHQNGNRRQNYKQGGSRGNQEQGQYYSKKAESQHEGGYTHDKEPENLSLKKNQNGGRKDKERRDKNKEKYEESYDTVYYVKKAQNGAQEEKTEEQKKEKNTKAEEISSKTEATENKVDKETIMKQLEAQAISIMSQLQPNKKVSNGVPRGTDSGVKTPAQLLNKPDRVSLTVPKPVIEAPAPSDTQSITGNNQSIQDDKDTISVISDTDTTHSKQAASIPPQPQIISPIVHPQMPASAEQQRVLYAPAFQQIPQLPVFHAPYIVFPQPNGTSIIQPLYQMPGMNMLPRRSEEEARFAQQPMYLVPSTLIPTPEGQQSNENRQRTESVPAQFYGGFPQFMPYAQMNPGFMPIPSQIVTQPVYSNVNEKELQRSATIDSQKEDNASDRRDD